MCILIPVKLYLKFKYQYRQYQVFSEGVPGIQLFIIQLRIVTHGIQEVHSLLYRFAKN